MEELTFLIVEDDRVGKLYMETLLKSRCKKLFFASNGIEAVDVIKKNGVVDIVLMDLKMPLMDGYEATARIKSLNPEIVIIAQTAFALAGDKEKALAAGCDAYITKPVKKEALFNLIREYRK